MKNAGPVGPTVQGNTPGASTTRHPGQIPVGYVTIHGAAQYASVSAKTVTRWIRSGLPVHQGTTRGKVLIRPGDIDAYLTRRQAPVVNLHALVDDVLQGLKRAA
ncbi:protein of unknown function [Nitrospira japonica]|uniref:Helix-turn-helix domain-containing protein n=1 Tax=Nitrospira japonica TaxID=1325564 RepID=A0A1W1I8N6_9BACT|nr:helix-turn-helix domain-containing protein [Nitrospira japonica]SLM49229.1 protein of unknown function [Nitrospira japonica]